MSIIYLLNCPSDGNSRPVLQLQSISNRNSFRRKEQSDLVLPFLYEDIFVSVWELFELWEKEVFKLMVKSVTCICFLFFFRNCTKVTNHLVHYTNSLFYKIQMILYLVHILLIEKHWKFLLHTKIAYDLRMLPMGLLFQPLYALYKSFWFNCKYDCL